MTEKMGICTIVPRDQQGFRPLVYGMGILLVNGREIVTCAHVIDAALGPGWQESKKQAVVRICFPFVDEYPSLEGTVDGERSVAPGRTSGGEPSDIAVIQLAEDAPSSAERAVLTNHVMDAPAKAYGFRGKEINGVWKSIRDGEWSDGKIMGAQPAGRAQFDGLRDISAPVERGFSGAGVYDPNLKAVVGMIVESDKDYKHIAQFIDVSSLKKVIGEQAADAIPPLVWSSDPIIEALKAGELVPVLGPSVNPKIYIDLAARLVELLSEPKPRPADSPSNQERGEEQKDFVRNHFGSPCTICHYLPGLRPPTCPLIAGFQPDSPLFDEQTLSVAKANCRSLSRLYEIKTSTTILYRKIIDIFDEYTKEKNTLYQSLAKLVHDWPNLSFNFNRGLSQPTDEVGEWQKKPSLPFSLIVTTSSDSGLEIELRKLGIHVDLVWYVAAGKHRGQFKYRPYNKNEETIVTKDSPLEAEIEVPMEDREGPPEERPPVVILKLFGTMRDSFLITQDQMDYFLSRAALSVPNKLLLQIERSQVLFLGFSPNDADLRAIVQRLYPEERKIENNSWLIHRLKAGKLDKEIWKSRGQVELLQVDKPLEELISDIRKGVGNGNI